MGGEGWWEQYIYAKRYNWEEGRTIGITRHCVIVESQR